MKTNMQNPFIVGKKVYLRPVESDDAELFVRWQSHPDVRYSFFIGIPTNALRQREFIENLYKDNNILLFMIVSQENNAPIGFTLFNRIDWIGRAATYGIIIGEPEEWGKGFGTEVTQLMVDYGFQTLGLNRIQLHVWKGNLRGLKAYQKAGFKKEGLLRQAMYHAGKHEDFYVMSILHSEYKKKPKTSKR
jgi:RimJ/RimL family protein N-acetyltransferase